MICRAPEGRRKWGGMIALQSPARQGSAPRWQHSLREAFSRPVELLRFLELDPALPQLELERLAHFPLRVPRGFAARMEKGNPRDPLFLQVWPRVEEGEEVAGFEFDAVGDGAALRGGGVLHKYQGRVLLIATGACAVHCRYCFRRHFPYAEAIAARDHWREALELIAADSSIGEVILSGGDPLSLSDERLAELFEALERIPHVRRLRIHTRQPIVLPERIDEPLLAILARLRLEKLVVLHANHARELDASVAEACAKLRDAGLILLNQSVLLRQVNDSVEAQQALCLRLFSLGILPYYLHMLDRVAGTAHFEVAEDAALGLLKELSGRLPGYLIPKLAREMPGEPGKKVLAW